MFTANEEKSLKDRKIDEKLKDKKIEEDCVECKYIGSAAFTGLGGYLFYLRMNTPVNAKTQRLFLAVFGTGMICLFEKLFEFLLNVQYCLVLLGIG